MNSYIFTINAQGYGDTPLEAWNSCYDQIEIRPASSEDFVPSYEIDEEDIEAN